METEFSIYVYGEPFATWTRDEVGIWTDDDGEQAEDNLAQALDVIASDINRCQIA